MQNKTISKVVNDLIIHCEKVKAMKVIGKLQEIIEMQREALETISEGNEDGYVFDKNAEEGSDGECACDYADRILEKLNNFQENKCKQK